MPVLASDLVCKCPNFERLKLESGSYRWNPYNVKGNTEGSLSDPVTTDSIMDEIAISHASPLYQNKGESIVYPSSNRRSGENENAKSCLLKAIS